MVSNNYQTRKVIFFTIHNPTEVKGLSKNYIHHERFTLEYYLGKTKGTLNILLNGIPGGVQIGWIADFQFEQAAHKPSPDPAFPSRRHDLHH